jgi:hypothetical protein
MVTLSDHVHLIGLFRSGTNYARTILEWNYDVDVSYDAYGWKHAMVPTFSNFSSFSYPEGKLVVVVKDPYSALFSWYKYAKKHGRNLRGDTSSFSNFLKNRIYFRDDTNRALAPEYYFLDPVQMWNSVVWNHLSVADQVGGVVVDYDELLRNPEETATTIARHFKLKRKSGEFENPGHTVRNMNDGLHANDKSRYLTNKAFDSPYQVNKQYLLEYSDDDLAFVGRTIDSDVVKRSGIKLGLESEDSTLPALYTVSGDTRLLPFACLLESNRAIDNLSVNVIPFDENATLTRELAKIYGARLVTPDPKWDNLGKAIYGTEEYRPGVPSWRYFRKFNVFDNTRRQAIFADSNIVLLNSVKNSFDALQTHDLVFGDRSRKGRNFPPWATQLLNVLDPNVQDGFNASFWISRCDLFRSLKIETFMRRPKIRVMLGKAPEQSFMLLIAVLLRKRVGALGEIDERVRPTLWGDVSPAKEIEHVLEHNVTRNGKVPLAVKWSGTAFHRKEAVASAHIYKPLVEKVLERVKDSRGLTEALSDQYRVVIQQ